jgi:flagellar biosynthesis/type III secretory pathway protein FliH
MSGDVESLKKEVEADPAFKSISRRTADMLNIVTNSDLFIEEKGDSVDMCKAIQGIREEGIELGRAEGRAEGKAEGKAEGEITIIDLNKWLFSQGRGSEIERYTENPDYLKTLLAEYSNSKS